MKALLLSNLYPSKREPTRGVFNQQVFGALSALCDVRVVSPRPWWTRLKLPQELLTIPQETANGVTASYPSFWGMPGFGVRFNGKAMHASLLPHLKQIRREFPFDIILAAWVYPDAYAAVRLGQDFGCPVVTNLMGSDINDLATRPELKEQIQWALQQSQHVIAVSEALRDRVVGLGVAPERVTVQHNGVNGERFALGERDQARAELGLPLDRKLIVYIGNFFPVKGTDILVEAMAHLAKRSPDADLLLVGSGELEESLRARVQALALESRVRFCGRQPHAQIPLWMRAGDVFCLPSRNEGCPNVILEALASGRPVVASHVGGIPELLHADNGILVPVANPEALAQGLHEALERTWSPAALRQTVEYLSWEDVGQAYHKILREALP
ncbi:glycosyltransferase family 4 protein [Armatimonas rosea]|uniref:Glycosyltransferase involved in cell wall biosynthesis n=1 Tax=Armatimonas rosea TaxID=685828 RepID=A0A7W9SLK8_ARMRO|nr:glycosyltransferase family 4 protein [Armatimonas rosea]MBB6048875.1 glycosyltransferase involved in cell wall biosynthesis [Armatimonas rosea]